MTQAHSNLLAGALEVDGALAGLRTLQVYCTLPGGLSMLTRVRARGAAPLLQRFYFDAARSNEADMISIADMIEARARIPGCERLEAIDGGGGNWLDKIPRPTRIRLLRVLLPSAKELPSLTWRGAFQACFRGRHAPYLTALNVCLGDDVAGFSWNVLEAAPALQKISIKGSEQTPLGATALRSVSAAMRKGALQNLEEVYVEKCTLGDADIRGLMEALEESGCAARLASLAFVSCEVGVDGMCVLTDLLSRGVFPALECLDLRKKIKITDVGVLALAEALLKSRPIRLEALDLKDVGMGDEGLSALASLVNQGRLEQLTWLDISDNPLTEQGIISLARAIYGRGLPMLEMFAMRELGASVGGIGAITYAVFKGCPQLQEIKLVGSFEDTDTLRELVGGMLEVAGRAGKVIYDADEDDDDHE